MKSIEIKKATKGKVGVTLICDPDVANELFLVAREKGIDVNVEKGALTEHQEEVKPTFEKLLKAKVEQQQKNK
ncbi:Uncharacterised protein [Serratia ficaria]|uniref:hypothetical protein n=1 Tax=Serratia ficaria TaxID=61651 RepID=UPI002183E5AC|nr:hypothetical protein [Serratia ficaria]CAI2538803.1 Uncharacterised protein [Serratia ficaria]